MTFDSRASTALNYLAGRKIAQHNSYTTAGRDDCLVWVDHYVQYNTMCMEPSGHDKRVGCCKVAILPGGLQGAFGKIAILTSTLANGPGTSSQPRKMLT